MAEANCQYFSWNCVAIDSASAVPEKTHQFIIPLLLQQQQQKIRRKEKSNHVRTHITITATNKVFQNVFEEEVGAPSAILGELCVAPYVGACAMPARTLLRHNYEWKLKTEENIKHS